MKTFISVAQMKLAFLTAGQLVETSGYYAAGDGGQARYLVKASESVDNVGNHDLAGTTVAILQSIGSLNVKQFGAKGDGVTNDTVSFDSAWTASNPAPVFVPVASYEIPGTVTGSFYSFGLVTIVTGTVNTIFESGYSPASTIVQGVVELATQAEVDAGADDERVFSPLKFKTSPGGWLTGSFVPVFTGFSVDPSTPVIRWTISGNLVCLFLDFSNGTSNATTFTITNLPVNLRPDEFHVLYLGLAVDNAANIDGCSCIIQNSAVMDFGAGHNNGGGGGWNAAAALKGIGSSGQILTYILDSTA